jgi:Fur family ferric uptake transcriptional regulator
MNAGGNDSISERKRDFEVWVKRRGLKRSGQRGAVVDVFLRNTDHVCCEDVHQIVKRRGLRIGYSTVYRTLKLLVAANLAREVNFGDGVTRFDHLSDSSFRNHYHMICTGCGQTVEFTSKTVDQSQRRIATRMGFAPQYHKLEVYGLCRSCRAVS